MKNNITSNASTAKKSVASVPLMITKSQRQQLYDLGYSKADVNAMPPNVGHDIISRGLTKSYATTIEQAFTISLFSGKGDAEPEETGWTLPQLIEELSTFRIGAKNGKLFSPAKFSPKHRDKNNVTELSLLALDYDHNATIREAVERWQRLGVRFLLYTTHSHQRITKDHPKAEDCFRLVFPLAEPIPANEYPRLWQWANSISGGKLDPACKDSSRMFYLPTKASKDAPARSAEL